MYELRCDKCGWYGQATDKSVIPIVCPKCHNSSLIIEIEEDDDTITEQIIKDENKTMQRQILKMGNNKIWEIIESLDNPIVRTSQRTVFLRNGGKVPKGKNIRI